MPRLTSRERQLPRNMTFYIAPLKWNSPPGLSFDQVVRSAISVLQSQPHVAQQLGWDLSYNSMADRVDEYMATLCEKLDMRAYYTGRPGGAPVAAPFMVPDIRRPDLFPHNTFVPNAAGARFGAPQPVARGAISAGVSMIKKLAAGAATLLDWESEGLPHVEQVVANSRAAICSVCPKNRPEKNLTDYFTVPLAAMIKSKMERLASLDLKTPHDEQLKVCEACWCAMRTKVWMPDVMVLKRLSSETKSELNQQNPRCWILDLPT